MSNVVEESTQIMKFEYEGKKCKLFFRYPDRFVGRLTEGEKALLKEEATAIAMQEKAFTEALDKVIGVSLDNLKYRFKRTNIAPRKGSGPRTTEFHIAYEDGETADGKKIYKEFFEPVQVKFHSDDKNRCYEKSRQYAIHKWFEHNKITKISKLHDLIIKAYEQRSPGAPKVCKNKDDISKLK